MENSLRSHQSHRFIFNVPGIDAYKIHSLKNIDEHTAELSVIWTLDDPLPSIHVTRGDLKIVDENGKVTDEWIISWQRTSTLPLNFDYSEQVLRIKILLYGIEIDFGTHT
jgi:hypothetical protein